MRLPGVEPGGKHSTDFVISLANLAEEVGDRAASSTAPFLLQRHERIGSSIQSVPSVETTEEVLLAPEHCFVGGFGDGPQ